MQAHRSSSRCLADTCRPRPLSCSAPQGGIDPLENPMRAALRELHEETAITSVRIVASVRMGPCLGFLFCRC